MNSDFGFYNASFWFRKFEIREIVHSEIWLDGWFTHFRQNETTAKWTSQYERYLRKADQWHRCVESFLRYWKVFKQLWRALMSRWQIEGCCVLANVVDIECVPVWRSCRVAERYESHQRSYHVPIREHYKQRNHRQNYFEWFVQKIYETKVGGEID